MLAGKMKEVKWRWAGNCPNVKMLLTNIYKEKKFQLVTKIDKPNLRWHHNTADVTVPETQVR